MARILYIGVAFLFLLSSCGQSPYYSEYHELPDGGWTYADTIPFSFEVPDTSRTYALFLDLEHSPDFPYSNFYVGTGCQIGVLVWPLQQQAL